MQSSSVEEQPHDLLRVGDQAQVFLAKNGYFSPPHWAEFWNSPKTASISATLITRILLILTGEDKHITVQDSVKKLANNSPGPIPELQRFPDLDADNIRISTFFVLPFIDPPFCDFLPFYIFSLTATHVIRCYKILSPRHGTLRHSTNSTQPFLPSNLLLVDSSVSDRRPSLSLPLPRSIRLLGRYGVTFHSYG
jgi:hypothetical protein